MSNTSLYFADIVPSLARYLAFITRERDVWRAEETETSLDIANMFDAKIETIRDICAMFDCRDAVWKESMKIYNPKG